MVTRMNLEAFDHRRRLGIQRENDEGFGQEDVANLSDFYNTMTEQEIYQDRMKFATRMVMGNAY